MAWIIEQWELEYVYPPSHNKFYRIMLFGNGDTFQNSTELRVVTQWGRIGTEGQHRVQVFFDYWSARELVDSTRDAKSGKGYVYTIRQAKVTPNTYVLLLAGITDTAAADQPVTVEAVEQEITELLTEISELNTGKGKRMPKGKYEDLMLRYSELVQKADEVTQETTEAAERTKQAISMAFTGVMNLGVK